MKRLSFRAMAPDLSAILIFIVIAFIYFHPVLEGKRLKTHDISMHKGMSKEISDYRDATGDEALWTNSMFGGMPAYQISVIHKSNLFRYVDKFFRLGLPHPIFLIFLYFIGFYILLRTLRINPWLSIIGALAYGFTTYYFIIIGAGHNSKAHALGYIAPLFAGIIMTYRGKLLTGGAITALFGALELRAGHPQITYYFVIAALVFALTEFISALKEKKSTLFFKASSILVLAGSLAVLTNITSLWSTWEYGKESIRGKSELTTEKENRTSGLDKDYATQWSYGISETWSLLIPNANGGASDYIGNNERAMKQIPAQWKQTIAQNSGYWGNQPFTSGPVYVGAFVLFMFILGLFIVQDRIKWPLLTATLLSVMLAWGHNFMPLTNLFLDYFPGYNKFRAVSMILVIAEFCIPLLGMIALNRIICTPELIKEQQKKFLAALALTGGIALLFALLPNVFFSFFSDMELAQFSGMRTPSNAAQIDEFTGYLQTARISIFRGDALRSALIIFAGATLLWIYSRHKIKQGYLILALGILIVVDLFPINKRYMKNDQFERPSRMKQAFMPTAADLAILKDKDINYRVFNQTVNTFNDASTSYFHKSIGGYHGAKLRRYQEVIEHHLTKNNMAVINMLNTKYFIVPNQQTNAPQPMVNPGALGNAWFVYQIKQVNNADEELDALNHFNPAQTAIIDKRFKLQLSDHYIVDSTATIKLVNYSPRELTYTMHASAPQLAIFSEIFYTHGWQAYIDNNPAEHFRANYILRGMNVPAGDHTISFRFEPRVINTGETISLISSLILLLMLAATALISYRKKKQA